MSREKKIKTLKIIVFSGFLAAIFHYTLCNLCYNLKYPFNTFLFRPEDRFNDFIHLYNLIANPSQPNPYTGQKSVFFQALFLIPAFFSLFNLTANFAVFLYLFVSFLLFVLISGISLEQKCFKNTFINLILCCIISYPFIFSFDRANIEIFVFLILFTFVKAIQNNKYAIAMILLGLAISIKPFPVVFLILFLIRKKFKEIVGVAFIASLISVISCYLRHGSLILVGSDYLQNYNMIYVIGNEGLYFGNSLWGVVKGIGFTFFPKATTRETWAMFAPFYFYSSVVFFLILSIWMFVRQPLFWKQSALLVCLMNLLPFISADYKLIHLFIPLFLFINEKIEEPLDKIYVFLFGFLLIPKAYGHIPGFNEASLSIIINPFLMISIVLLIVFSEYKKPRKPVGDLTANPVPAL